MIWYSIGFEEFQLESTVDHAPNTTNGKGQAKGNSQPAKSPIEVPIEAVLCRLFDEDPHEARVRKCDWKCETSEQTSQAGEEWERHPDEEGDEPVEHSEAWSHPYRARAVCAASVASFEAVEDRHRVDLEAAKAVEDHQ